MHVHFITIKIGIVWSGHRKIQSECLERKYFDSVPHKGHLMKRRLTIKDDIVIIH